MSRGSADCRLMGGTVFIPRGGVEHLLSGYPSAPQGKIVPRGRWCVTEVYRHTVPDSIDSLSFFRGHLSVVDLNSLFQQSVVDLIYKSINSFNKAFNTQRCLHQCKSAAVEITCSLEIRNCFFPPSPFLLSPFLPSCTPLLATHWLAFLIVYISIYIYISALRSYTE